jgi:hypothetical protein
VAVKVTAVVVVPFGMLLALGPGRRWRAAVLVAAGAGGAFAGLTLLTGLGLGWSGALAGTGVLVQWSSLPTGLGMAAGYALWGLGMPEAYGPAVAVARLLGLVVLAAVVVAALVTAWRRVSDPRMVVAAAGAAMAAVVVLGPVLYPWYAVPPLAVLAAAVASRRGRRWLAGATIGLTALVLPSGLGLPVLTKFPGAMLVAATAVAVTLLAWRRRPPGWRWRPGASGAGHRRVPREPVR